jgi:hypothetical protein
MKKSEICRTEVQKNIINVEVGKPLTIPLVQLNRYCKFRKAWYKFVGVDEETKAKVRAYFKRPEVKAKMRAYYQRPEVKAKRKEYQQKYYQRPEVKARAKATMRKRLNITKSRRKIK